MKARVTFELDIPKEAIKKSVDEALKENPDLVLVVRCKDCKWFNSAGCAIEIKDELDSPGADDYCSFAERKDDKDKEEGDA